MNSRTKLYIAGGVLAFAATVIIGTSLLADRRTTRLESEISKAKAAADKLDAAARTAELNAAEYKRKIEYLEASLTELNRTASKQNEELKSLAKTAVDSRRNADRARAVRRVESTTADLCRKLAELGHPCE